MQVHDTNKNRRRLIIAALLCIVLHLVFAPHIGIFAARINVCLLVGLWCSLHIGGTTSVVAGFCFGLLYDLTTSGPVGLMAFELTLLSFAFGSQEQNKLSSSQSILIQKSALAIVLVELIYSLVLLMLGHTHDIVGLLLWRTLPAILMEVLVFALVVVGIFSRISSSAAFFSAKISSTKTLRRGGQGLSSKGASPKGSSKFSLGKKL